MKRKIEMPNIPCLKNAVIAINIDRKMKKEHIIVGDFDSVNRYIRGGKKDKIIFEKIRPIGSFLLDIIPNAGYFATARVCLCDISKQKRADNISIIEDLYATENPIFQYIALKLWQEYNNIIKAEKDKDEEYSAIDRLEDLTLPFRHNLMNEILEWQRTNPFNPLVDMPYEYFKYPVQNLLVADTSDTAEYVVSDFALMPLVSYYLKIIYEKEKYFSYCKVCGKLFLAPDVNKTVICSEKCRNKQKKLNKKRYDDENRNVDYERTYRNEKMYWYNRIQKAKRLKADDKIIAKLEKEFCDYKRVALIKKKQVKTDLLSSRGFCAWLLSQRDTIDELMLKYGLNK